MLFYEMGMNSFSENQLIMLRLYMSVDDDSEKMNSLMILFLCLIRVGNK